VQRARPILGRACVVRVTRRTPSAALIESSIAESCGRSASRQACGERSRKRTIRRAEPVAASTYAAIDNRSEAKGSTPRVCRRNPS